MTHAESLFDQIFVVFDRLIAGALSPEEASDWATLIIHEGKKANLPDGYAAALATIGLASMKEPDGQLIYGVADFKEWRDEVFRELRREK
ncbi:hypothetical protein [Asticcacaulis sp. 201]|uniref:hypothetical protein n=1 Tax=Asticcacaulis sp. 201 TaxID=3028787 RepID=UPI0029168311|nr:hypothetical protein [Asticcacaulis sp. 201]MDV6329605.1 hypothetical protein [Asticcacaulis sp. 201]